MHHAHRERQGLSAVCRCSVDVAAGLLCVVVLCSLYAVLCRAMLCNASSS